MSEIILEIDERTMENLMTGPYVFIEETRSPAFRKIAYFNKAAFKAYSHLIDEHGCTGFSIEVEDVAENKLQDYFFPGFSDIRKKNDIVEIGIVGSGAFPEDLELDVFKDFPNIRKITTQSISFRFRLPELFPKLESWLNLDWKTNKVGNLDNDWHDLTNLSLHGFSGSLVLFENSPIKKLFLISSTIKSIDDVLSLKKLEVLQIVSSKITGNVSRLSELTRLRSLRFEGKNQLEGWDKLESKSVENFEASHYPCKFPRQNFPKLKNYVVNAYRARDSFYEEGGDHDALGAEFAAL
ncbi:hypothetical protein [Agrobacterium sp. lyk4-40-TYG-31]|uniref:hypothetical protein n=2 Tax=Agrobacterium TaxID=357 RepID=UPI00254A8773|nr:hypothetical protein [Agrobacterium sp. lyk4-40-TYG-31]